MTCMIDQQEKVTVMIRLNHMLYIGIQQNPVALYLLIVHYDLTRF